MDACATRKRGREYKVQVWWDFYPDVLSGLPLTRWQVRRRQKDVCWQSEAIVDAILVEDTLIENKICWISIRHAWLFLSDFDKSREEETAVTTVSVQNRARRHDYARGSQWDGISSRQLFTEEVNFTEALPSFLFFQKDAHWPPLACDWLFLLCIECRSSQMSIRCDKRSDYKILGWGYSPVWGS